MINVEELGARIILGFGEGKLFITESTLFGLVIAVILAVLGIWLGSGLKTVPKGKQVVAEFIVGWVYKFTENNMGKENKSYAPYFGNILGGFIVIELWLHLMTHLSNMITTVPFLRAVTVLPLNAIFDIAEPLIQTYIFTTLTVINLGSAVKIMSVGHSE